MPRILSEPSKLLIDYIVVATAIPQFSIEKFMYRIHMENTRKKMKGGRRRRGGRRQENPIENYGTAVRDNVYYYDNSFLHNFDRQNIIAHQMKNMQKTCLE